MASVIKKERIYKGETKVAWLVRWTDQGGIERSKSFRKKGDADKHRLLVEVELSRGVHTADTASITVKEACERYLKLCEQRHREKDRMARTTLEHRRCMAKNHIVPFLGAIKLSRLTAPIVQEWADKLRNDPAKPRSAWIMAHVLQVLRQAITEAQRVGLVAQNVVRAAPPRVAQVPRGQIEIPQKDEMRSLLAITADELTNTSMGGIGRAGLAVEIATFTGLREGEIFALTWPHVRFEERLIRVRHSVNRWQEFKEPKSRAGIRDVPIPPRLLAKLREWKVANAENPRQLVIATRDGTPMTAANFHATEWRRVMKRAELVDEEDVPIYHFHALRHFAASLFIEQGLPPKRVQYLMGHSSITMTFDRYGHLFPDDDAAHKAATAMEAQLAPTGKIPGTERLSA